MKKKQRGLNEFGRSLIYLGIRSSLLGIIAPIANALPSVDRIDLDHKLEVIESLDKVTVSHQGDAVIYWHNFDLNSGEVAEFINGGALSLNKVIGSGRSLINGTILSDGRVAIVNSNGVVFGSGAVVNVGGLIVSGIDADIDSTNADGFLNVEIGGQTVSIPDSYIGTVETNGTIKIHGDGGVVLVGKKVDHKGTIEFVTPDADVQALAGRTHGSDHFEPFSMNRV